MQGWLRQPLASVTLAVKVQLPGVSHEWVLVTDPATPVIVSLMHPLNTTVNGPVPLVIDTVKAVELPTQFVALAGVILQIGLGLTTKVA